ncbi:MAG: aminotransferase class I/II-fold pyridoxal phosphate-dependent enzyme [Methanobacteriota archaeon]|nr:MAG: aminotransferase class I/II-fold pyridoxal phosphate-dependent enzyme [Euryarchaeota archaeon]
MRIPSPKRLAKARYAIRDIVKEAKKVEKAGKKVIYLNSGDPLRHGFDIPQELKEELCKAVANNNKYGDPVGELSTREAISKREKTVNGISLDSSNIVVGNGISEVFLLICAALLDEGDEILVPGPTYPIYKAYPEFLGAKVVEYRCDENSDWQPDIEDIRAKITPKTVAIVIINPNNPSGALYSSSVVKAIVDVAAEHSLIVFSDEIYDHNILEGEFRSTASLTSYPIIGLNGISKAFFATGWRFGYMYIANPTEETSLLLDNVKKVANMRAYTNMPIQAAVSSFFDKEPYHMREAMDRIRKNRDYIVKRIGEIDGLSLVKPRAAFYAFPSLPQGVDDKDFVLSLLKEEGVLFVHGSGFGESGRGHFRIVYLGSEEELSTAMDGLERHARHMF